MYLPDTHVFSELKKIEGGTADPQVVRGFATTRNKDVWLSVVVCFESTKGILAKHRGDPAQAVGLRQWYEDELVRRYRPRILHITQQVAERCAELHMPDPPALADSLLAATALHHGLVVVTRNVRRFRQTGVRILNPWD